MKCYIYALLCAVLLFAGCSGNQNADVRTEAIKPPGTAVTPKEATALPEPEATEAPVATDQPSIEQKILLEVFHVNHAAGYTLKGFYIDHEGNVFGYDHSDGFWNRSASDAIGEKDLLEKYQHGNKKLGTVEAEDLAKYYRLIERASTGEVPEAKDGGMRDYGSTYYLAFLWQADQSQYIPIILRQEGDWVRDNTSGSAGELVQWLKEIKGTYQYP